MSSTLINIPRRAKAFGRLWAIKFMVTNPTWRDGDTQHDEWHAFGDYDFNLYCEDGYLSVCAYAMHMGEDGFFETDHDDFVYIVQKGDII
jgi:hypothetical protein